MRKPNVFLAGAPKCGTTSMARWLSEHPHCYVSTKKEPHYFSDLLKKNATIDEYEALFELATDQHKACIDASTSYFSDPVAISQILQYHSDAKFLIMLRNPVDLAYSLHSELLYQGVEDIDDFASAWQMQEIRRTGESVPLSCQNPRMLMYRDQSLLGQSLQLLIESTKKQNIHWTYLEGLQADSQLEYQKVLAFLQLKDDGRTEFIVYNRSRRHRFQKLNRMLRTIGRLRHRVGLPGLGVRVFLDSISKVESHRTPLPEEFRMKLYESFYDDIQLLQKITGRDLCHWCPRRE